MGILSWLVVGLIAGFIGSKVVNRSGKGWCGISSWASLGPSSGRRFSPNLVS